MAVDNTNRLLSVSKLVLILDIDQTILQASDSLMCARLHPQFMRERNIHAFMAQGKLLHVKLRCVLLLRVSNVFSVQFVVVLFPVFASLFCFVAFISVCSTGVYFVVL